jgi:hypothetical protein
MTTTKTHYVECFTCPNGERYSDEVGFLNDDDSDETIKMMISARIKDLTENGYTEISIFQQF